MTAHRLNLARPSPDRIIESTREAAEAQINRYRNVRT